MRLTALLLLFVTGTVAKNAPDVSGVWMADLARSDFATAPSPNRVSMSVTRDGNRLNVVQVVSDKRREYVADRQFLFKGAAHSLGVGTVKTAGRKAILP